MLRRFPLAAPSIHLPHNYFSHEKIITLHLAPNTNLSTLSILALSPFSNPSLSKTPSLYHTKRAEVNHNVARWRGTRE